MLHPDSLGPTEERTTRPWMLSHFGNATFEFRDAFVQSLQFMWLSDHDNHND
jgi:hypothetical protein